MSKLLSQKISELPKKPGVYIFKDAQGLILYVGKAVRLKDRVSSYFKKASGGREARIEIMVSQIADLDYAVTDNEVESLILENNFIKQLKPKYNVMLRDDKNYLFLKINLHDEIPTFSYERKIEDRKSKYFGPYTSAQSLRDTMRMIRRIFPYCANSKVSDKPCFFYHIQKCPGVCIGKISPQEYRENHINKIMGFLEGKQTQVLKELQGLMKYYAKNKQFERAARTRDQIFALNRVLERQKLVMPNKVDLDVFSVYEEAVVSVNLFIVREGKLIQKENFVLENTKHAPQDEVLKTLLNRYYLDTSNLPREILLPIKFEDPELGKIIGNRSGRKVKFSVPARGPKSKLMRLGEENAKQYLEAQSDKHLLEEARLLGSLKELQRVLELKDLPGRIEAFDISNIQGTNAVGSMIVFGFGKPDKPQYRKFKIKTKSTPDDFAMMREMLDRRFARSMIKGKKGERTVRGSDPILPITPLTPFKPNWPLPDLILIDGGKGQLSAAVKIMRQHKLDIPIIGLAKRLEEIFRPANPTPYTLPPNSIALFLLQRIRDEAHRFAITYHKKLRSKSAIKSALDSISGIGPAKKKRLLEQFGSVARLREAGLSDIANIVGTKAAEKIKASL